MASTLISLRMPPELLERLRSVAKERGVTVTDLLLGPWRDGEVEPVVASPRPTAPARSSTVVASPKRERVEVAAPKRLTLADVRGPFKPNLKKR